MKSGLKIESAIGNTGANPMPAGSLEDSKTEIINVTPRVKYNEELNGYHFHNFSETFICREELPQGSKTFQQVLEEITQELDSTTIPEEVMHVTAINNRRKSVAVFRKKTDNGFQRRRRISFGRSGNTHPESARQIRRQSSSLSFTRPRVCSDGAVVTTRKTSLHV